MEIETWNGCGDDLFKRNGVCVLIFVPCHRHTVLSFIFCPIF